MSQQLQNNAIRRRRRPPLAYVKAQENNTESLKTCGFLFINHLLKLTVVNGNNRNDKLREYMDEILHSIFFLGYIFKDRLKPDDFFKNKSNSDCYQTVMGMFPEPFQKYNTHLPNRTPFSILLDVMEALYRTEERIEKELLRLLKELQLPEALQHPGNKNAEYYTLESTVICVCSSDSDSRKYFGASLSCRKRDAKRIFIDISCLKTWHDYVAHAVMSFYEPPGDGITFPETVKCQAYIRDWNRNVYEERRPCLNCKHLFNLQDADQDSHVKIEVHHPYGNCAETEGLSKLLRNNGNIRDNAVINNHTEIILQNLRDKTRARLASCLNKAGFKVSNENIQIYEPNANGA